MRSGSEAASSEPALVQPVPQPEQPAEQQQPPEPQRDGDSSTKSAPGMTAQEYEIEAYKVEQTNAPEDFLAKFKEHPDVYRDYETLCRDNGCLDD